MKKLLSIICVFAISASVLLTGCTPKGKEVDEKLPENPSKTEETKLRVAWWGSQARHDRTIAVVDKYTAENSNIKIEYEFNGFAGYWDKIATQAAAQNLPDVWQNSINYIKSYVEKDQLLDLTPYVESGIIDLSDWDQSVIDMGKVDGKIYAIPMGMTAHGIAYNPQLFADAGLEKPTNDWTWEEYMQTAKAIKDKLKIYGDSDFAGSNIEGFDFYLRQHGQSLFSEDGKSLGYTDDNLFVEYNKMALEMMEDGSLMPIAQSLETSSSIESTAVVTGKAAMLGACNSNQLSAIYGAGLENVEIVSLPHKKDEVNAGNWLTPSMYLTASKKNTNPEESAKLINYILNDVGANKILLGERGVPGGEKAREAIKPELDKAAQKAVDYVAEIAKIAAPFNPLKPPAIAEMTDVYTNLEQSILFKQTTPEKAAAEFRKISEAALKK